MPQMDHKGGQQQKPQQYGQLQQPHQSIQQHQYGGQQPQQQQVSTVDLSVSISSDRLL